MEIFEKKGKEEKHLNAIDGSNDMTHAMKYQNTDKLRWMHLSIIEQTASAAGCQSQHWQWTSRDGQKWMYLHTYIYKYIWTYS